MRFSYYKNFNAPAVDCSREVFLEAIHSEATQCIIGQARKCLADNDRKGYDEFKRRLPAVTWQAWSDNGSHQAIHMRPSGLAMIDVDHLQEDPREVFSRQIEPHLNEAGVVCCHVTPSGEGLRIVIKTTDGRFRTLTEWQTWASDLFGLQHDEATGDFSRLAFLAGSEDFLFIDEKGLWEDEPLYLLTNPHAVKGTSYENENEDEDGTSYENENKKENENLKGSQRNGGSVRGALTRTFTEEQQTSTFNGHLIREIAEAYFKSRGLPPQGERHGYYYKAVNEAFRYITDDNVGVMLCQLPDLGLPSAERVKMIEHACSRPQSDEMPAAFRKFLLDGGFMGDDEVEAVDAVTVPRKRRVPAMPRVFNEWCSICPPDFSYPSVAVLASVLGCLGTRLRATWIDGTEMGPSFITIIFADQASGKSFARRIFDKMTKYLRLHDAPNIARQEAFRDELRWKKGSDTQQLPRDPKCPFRIVPPVSTIASFLESQKNARGLTQICLCEEVDEFTRGNSGAFADKRALLRIAFDQSVGSQQRFSADSFSGSVVLRYNAVLLGTPNQLQTFLGKDIENGLVSRCCFAKLRNQQYAPIPVFKKMTEAQEAVLEAAMQRFERLTYIPKETDDEEEEAFDIAPELDVTERLEFLRKPLARWLEETRRLAIEKTNRAMDIFRRRSAVKAYRLGIICVGLYDKSEQDKKLERMIRRFVLWFASQDLEETLEAFGEQLNKCLEESAGRTNVSDNLFQLLPDEFGIAELEAAIKKLEVKTRPRQAIYLWKKNGLITEPEGRRYRKK